MPTMSQPDCGYLTWRPTAYKALVMKLLDDWNWITLNPKNSEQGHPGNTRRAPTSYNLADLLFDIFLKTNDIANLGEAITLHRTCDQVGHPNHHISLYSLACYLKWGYCQKDTLSDRAWSSFFFFFFFWTSDNIV